MAMQESSNSDGMKITNVMIYAKLMEVNENQIAMRVELNQMADHEARIRFIERKLWLIMGGSGIIASLLTVVISKGLGL
jgi:hypothetical protein